MPRLSPRQFDCLTLSATLKDQQIADRLGISVHSVRKHIQEAKQRFGVQDRKAALRVLATFEGGENRHLPPVDEAPTDPGVRSDFSGGRDAGDPVPNHRSWRRPSGTGIHVNWLILAGAVAVVLVLSMVASVLTFLDNVVR